jgi:5'-phosphate synthase pdxT subunit
MLTAGVVAVQGDVSEHADAISRAAAAHGRDCEVREVRQSGIVPDCDLLAIPGGESTTISRLLDREGIAPEVRDHVAAGKPVLATCAGLIVAARDANDDRVDELGLVDASVERNAFGRQKDSFEAPLSVAGLDEPFHAVFIRAPVIAEVGDGRGSGAPASQPEPQSGSGDGVEVLAAWNGRPVAIRDGPVVGTSFHPELTDDHRIHDLAFFERALAEQ